MAIVSFYCVYPMFYKILGVIPGLTFAIFSLLINYKCCCYIFELSTHAQENDYSQLVNKYLGGTAEKIANYTLLIDYSSSYLYCFLVFFQNYVYFVNLFGLLDRESIIDETIYDFDFYSDQLNTHRFFVMLISFAVLIYFFLKDNLDGLKVVFVGLFWVFSALILFLVYDTIEMGLFHRSKGIHSITLARFDTLGLKFLVTLLTGFYIQSNALTIKEELTNPTMTRLVKILRISYLFYFLVGIVFGLFVYVMLGDENTNIFFILRPAYSGKRFEWLHHILVLLMAIYNLLFGSFFNITYRNYILNNFSKKANKMITGIIPLFFAAVIIYAYPKIINISGIFGIISYSANGYFFPLIMKLKLKKIKEENDYSVILLKALIFIILLMCIGTSYGLIVEGL